MRQDIKQAFPQYVIREFLMNQRTLLRSATGIFFISILLVIGLAIPASAITLNPGATPSTSSTISNGDPVTVTGVATGHPNVGLQVWLIGYNMVKVSTISVNNDNTYTYELKSADTQNLASGQYLVIVQHPMMNGQFDITYNPSTGKVINRQMMASGGSGSGTEIFQLTSSGSLQSTNSASALMAAINSQNVDDTFATASFYISPPDAFVHPVGDHAVGDKFTITGTTNLAAGDKLQVDVYSSSFSPTKKSQSGEYSGASGVVEVTAGTNGRNQWAFDVDASGFRPDEYIVTVAGIIQNVHGSATFNILAPTSVKTPVTETVVTTSQGIVQPTVSAAGVPPTQVPTTRQSDLPAGITGIGLLGVIMFLMLKKERT
jgi:hypothetical protein